MNRGYGSYLFTSESVTEGHPDKVSDRVSDAVLDAFIAEDPQSLVACETMVTTDRVIVSGEVYSQAKAVDVEKVTRAAIADIGYVDNKLGFNALTCQFENLLHEQSADIRQGVDRNTDIGAGDQGLMFGYACNETPELMPLSISLSHSITRRLAELRKSAKLPWLRPDGKAQVTIEYVDQKPVGVHTVVVSTQHEENITLDDIRTQVLSEVIVPVLPADVSATNTVYHINPTGRFVVGGPHGDTGVTGRKIIVDTYGGYAPHGGGAFSGKDPTKVDRSAAYAGRYIAKNFVAAGLADRFQIQLAYAIGVSEPVSIHFNDFGTLKVDRQKVLGAIREVFPLTPKQIIEDLDLRRPIYSLTSSYGHFGRNLDEFTWERADKVDDLKNYFSI